MQSTVVENQLMTRKIRRDQLFLCIFSAWAFAWGESVFAGPAASPEVEILSPSPMPTPSPLPVLSLSESIHRTLEVWPGLKAAEFDVRAIESKVAEASRAYFLPEVKLRVFGGLVPDVPSGFGPESNFPKYETDWSQWGPFLQTRVEALQPLYTFGKLSNVKEAAERGKQAKEFQVLVVQNELISRVKDLYIGLQFLMSALDFVNEMEDRTQKAKDRVDELLSRHSAEVTDIDSMRVEVFLVDAKRRKLEIKNGLTLGQATLGILTGGPGAGPVSVEQATLQPSEISIRPVDFYLERARVKRPELQQLESVVAIRKALWNAQSAGFFPSFFLGGFFHWAEAPGRADVSNPYLSDDFNRLSGGGAIGFEQSLAFHMTDARSSQAKAEYLKAVEDRKAAAIGVELEIRKSLTDVMTKQESMKLARDGFRAGRSWVTASTLNFGVGLLPVKDLLEAFIGYSRVRSTYLDSVRDYYSALTMLAKVVGEEVTDLKY